MTTQPAQTIAATGFTDAATYGFSPDASGVANLAALQRAVDGGGTIVVSRPGIYRLAGTVFIGSDTALRFGHGVVLRKVDEQGPFMHVLLNKGALTRVADEHILIEGLTLEVNGMDVRQPVIYGLLGHIAFFHVKDLRIERFRCPDLCQQQYCIHVCTFEDLIIDDVIISGEKDGVHLGRGKRFRISNGVFKTFDDAIALNAHDYDVGNPEMGWIEDGLIENCHDLNAENTDGYFCRILAGGWIDWRAGMEVQKSDTVVSEGRLYRVFADADAKVYRSLTRPTHASGQAELDGITWVMVQGDVTYTAGVRNVTFRSIFLSKPRTAFSVHFDNTKWSRSYYPGAQIPQQQGLVFDDIRVLHRKDSNLLEIGTPVDVVTISNSSIHTNRIVHWNNHAMSDWLKTTINLVGCTFTAPGSLELLHNQAPGKRFDLRTTACLALHDDFTASVAAGPGTVAVTSDLPGLEVSG